jgi:ABC-2 type transport system ATP-binding protein
MDVVIEARDLTKRFPVLIRRPGFRGALRAMVRPEYDSKTAVENVTMAVRRGELVALLGPNGAGKSTIIKMLTGILTPTSGTIRVAGLVPTEDRIANARRVGAVFGQRSQLWFDLPARQSFTVLRDIFEVDDAAFRSRLGELDDLLSLSEFWDTRVRHLSLGQRVRCDLAAAFLHDPAVVFLDEPTIGMDAVVKEQVRDFLRHEVSVRGRTVLLTTHDMTEVDRLAERVVLVTRGRVAYDGTLSALRQRFGAQWRIRVTLERPFPGLAVPGVRTTPDGERVYVLVPDDENPIDRRDLVRHLVAHYPVDDIVTEQGDLEAVLRAAYRARAVSPIASLSR